MVNQMPTVYLFYGDDDFVMEEAVAQIKDKLGDPATADLNTTRFDLKAQDLGALAEACGAAPFLAQRRVVIVEDAGHLTRSAEARQKLDRTMLDLPASTALVLLDPVDLSRRTSLAKHQKRSFLYQWTQDNPDRAFVQLCARKRGQAFARWLVQRAQDLGVEIEPDAAERLATYVLDDPHLADQELRKLADYVDMSRPITAGDVEDLTPLTSQSDVFAMVDSLGNRQGQQALAHLHNLLADEDPMFAFAMIVRQFRLILQAREALDNGLNPHEVLNTHAFVVDKVSAQARNFTMPQLETIYRKLSQIDYEAKSGGPELAVAMDTLLGAVAG
jgi:DNA polymerase-3 subunit delta